jgi:predicted transcriptional regulator
MYITIEQIKRGLTAYIDNEMGRKATGFNKFKTYFMLPIIIEKVAPVINAYHDNVMAQEFFDTNGDIDVDKLYNFSKQAIHVTGQFELMGMIFNETDFDKLYTYIKNA